MSGRSKISVSVFEIDLHHFASDDFNTVVDSIIINVNREGHGASEEPLAIDDFGSHKVALYSIIKRYPPRWKGFINKLLAEGSPLKASFNLTHSYICFIGSGTHIYCVAGGYGSTAIARYTKGTFGLDLLVRLFEKDSRIIRAIQDRGLTGIVLGQSKFYRGDQRLADENQFGKIFQSISAEMSREILSGIFGIPKTDIRRKVAGCLAKSSFEIKKAIDFDRLLSLTDRFSDILDNMNPKFTLNQVQMLSRHGGRYRELTETLDSWVINQLFNDHKRGIKSDIELCHPEFEKYRTADSYIISLGNADSPDFDTAPSLSEIVRSLGANGYLEDDTGEQFGYSVLHRILKSLDQDGNILTTRTVFGHINGEFIYNNKAYFLMDGEWYQILLSFVEELNKECFSILMNAKDTTLITKPCPPTLAEKDFNASFIGSPGFIVLDRITPENIEACDLLQFDEDSVNLIHVKKGFDNSIRELTSQINIGAKRIQQDIRNETPYLLQLEEKAKLGVGSVQKIFRDIGNQTFPQDGLRSIFLNKRTQQIYFCLAFVDDATVERSVFKDLQKFNSNIAKFSILELQRELNMMGIGFKVIQLTKE